MAAMDEGDYKTDIDLYEKGRPEYSKESVEYLLNHVGAISRTDTKPCTILELGAGTGKFTRAMAEMLKMSPNVRLIASDSKASMCEKFNKVVPGVEMLQFKAEKIPFPDESIDIVISAQGFHWFANDESVSEIHRVLVPKGRFGMIWNVRNHMAVDWVRKIQDVIQPYFDRDAIPRYLDHKWMHPLNKSKLFGNIEGNDELMLYQEGSADDIMTALMCLSSVSQSSPDEKKDIETKVRNILANHPDLKGLSKFRLPYVTPIYWCQKL